MPKYTPDLTTLTQVKTIQGIDASNTDDDALLTFFIHAASEWLGTQTNRTFVPYVDTKYYDCYGQHINRFRLTVDDDLLAVTTLTNGNATVISSADYDLEPYNNDPKFCISLHRSSSVQWLFSTDWRRAISIAGIWGYHENYARAWPTRTTLNEALDASETDVTVTSATGIEVLQYIKVESEVMQVTAISGTTLTVERGVLGTTPAEHVTSTPLYTYRYPPMVQYTCNRLVTFFYEHRDTIGQQIQMAGSVTVIEGLIPPEITEFTRKFEYMDLWAAHDG